MSKDILRYETGNGGDFKVLNNDLVLVESLLQMFYIALFGGNVEADTRGDEISTEVRQDWWANSLLFAESKNKQFNSKTERVLNSVALNSSGRVQIKTAIEDDLSVFRSIAKIEVEVSVVSEKKARLYISATKPNQQEAQTLQILWDNARNEVILEQVI